MDIFCDTDDPVASLKPGKMRTIHLHRRPSMPYFGFGVSQQYLFFSFLYLVFHVHMCTCVNARDEDGSHYNQHDKSNR